MPTPALVTASAPNIPTVIQGMAASPASSGTAAASGGGGSPNVPTLTAEQRKIVTEFKQKMAQLPPDQQHKFISDNKAVLIKQLNFQPAQLQLLRNNHFAQQQQRMQQQMDAASAAAAAAASSVASSSDSEGSKSAVAGEKRPAGDPSVLLAAPTLKQKRIAWVESQIKKDQNEAVTPNYRTPFRSKEDACKRLLRYHVFDELDESPKEMMEAEEAFETRAEGLLSKYRGMLNKYHYLLGLENMVRLFFMFFLVRFLYTFLFSALPRHLRW